MLIELSQISDNALSWSTLCSIGLNKRPIGMSFTVLASIAWSNEHA